jgi:transcriptional regulator with XRE-family HTH domain
MNAMTTPRCAELGDFLRSRRARLDPADVGLSSVRRRRTPGLRREEVAELAGIGVDWYVRLEQGRAVSPSVTTIDALARALCLKPHEHAHLSALARPPDRPAFARETVPASIRRLVEALAQPAYVTGRRWDVLAWNAAASDIFADLAREAEDERNVLVHMLTHPGARRLFGPGWADEARRMLAQFRATHDLFASDPAFVDLLDRLRRGCPEFSAWWEAHDIRGATGGRKVLHHPLKGLLTFEYATFQANDDPALKLAIYTRV